MENYIVINGKKAELTEDQLKALGIEVPKASVFDRRKEGEKYYFIDTRGDVESTHETGHPRDNDVYNIANYCADEALMKQRAPQSIESHEEITDADMLEVFHTEYGWTDLANQQLFWDEANGRVVINYYFEALADEWQMDSAREYGLTTFVFKRQNSLGGPHAYQMWASQQEIKEVVIQVFCNGIMNYQDIYGGIEDRIVHTESHYEK